MSIGVSNYNTSPNGGTRYVLTRNDDSRIVVGYVEVTGKFYNCRTAFDTPVEVGSKRYDEFVAAVKRYLAWRDSIQYAFNTSPRKMELVTND